MGVDFYICHNCRDTFPDCGPYEQCECGRHWCAEEYSDCAREEGFRQADDYDEKTGERESSCNFCRKESAEDKELLAYALELLKTSRKALEKKYLKTKS